MALTNKLTNIANAIRAKTGESSKMSLDEMPEKIDSISRDVTPPYVEETYNSSGNLISATLVGQPKVRSNMFNGCSGLTSITITDSVTSIGSNAFSGCTALTTINLLRADPPTISSTTFSDTSALESIIVPKGSGDAYKSAQYWSSYASKIKEAE